MTARRAARAWPLLLVALALVVGWVASSAFSHGPATQLTIKGKIEGTVAVVNFDGSGICIRSDADGNQYCSQPMQVQGTTPLKIGDHVIVTDAFVDLGGSSAIEVYIVTSPAPPHG